MTKWVVVYAVERAVEHNADNINEVAEMAERGKICPAERIVSIRIQR